MTALLAFLGIELWNSVFKPVLLDLAKTSAKDFAKDFCKDSLKHVLLERDEWKKAARKALIEFVKQFETQLKAAVSSPDDVKGYVEPLRRFAVLPAVRGVLGEVVADPMATLNVALLAETWSREQLEPLPAGFDWERTGRRYEGQARHILDRTPKLRELIQAELGREVADAAQRLAGLAPGFDVARYAEALRVRYGYLKIESLDPNPDHQRIALTRIFVEPTVRSCQQFNPRVYELPAEHRRRLQEKGAAAAEYAVQEIKEQRRRFESQTPSKVLTMLADPARRLVVVLGDPGSGKSVRLENLALSWADRSAVDRALQPLPLLIELKSYIAERRDASDLDLLAYLDHGSGTVYQLDQNHADALLARGQAVLLLDGLDEIFDAEVRREVVNEIARLTTKYPNARLVATSRTIGYDLVAPALRDAGFEHYLLDELDSAQQSTFIERWHDLAYADGRERAEKAGRLRASIEGSTAIAELARNPLLLTLMALLNRHQELPRDRNELYEQASKLMLQQWDASRALEADPALASQRLDYQDKQSILRAVAARMQSGEEGLAGNIIAGDDLEQTLVDWLTTRDYRDPRPTARRLIQQLRERNFILCLLGDVYFAFVHRTFLEFFCAWSWTWRFEKDRSLDLADLRRQTFEAHWQDEKWHEVLRLIAARLETPFAVRLIEGLIGCQVLHERYIRGLLAALCFMDLRGRAGDPSVEVSLRAELEALVCHPKAWNERPAEENEKVAATVEAVAACWPGEEGTRAWLLDRGSTHADPVVRQAAIGALARRWAAHPATVPWLRDRVVAESDCVVRLAALHCVVSLWSADPEKRCWLRGLAVLDQDEAVRLAAVRTVVRHWPDDPTALPWLRQIAESDCHQDVRRIAVRAMAQCHHHDCSDLSWLGERAELDEHHQVRAAAVQTAAVGWHDDPATLPWLRKRAVLDEHYDVREAAVQAIAQGWPNDPATPALLSERALNDEHWVVRKAAVGAMVQVWHDDPATVALLRDRALNDPDVSVRHEAVQAVAQRWPDDPETFALLRDRALNDEDSFVRWLAVEAVTQGWLHGTETHALLRDRALSDPDARVRWLAVEAIAQCWRDDAGTLALLRDRELNDPDEDLRDAVANLQPTFAANGAADSTSTAAR